MNERDLQTWLRQHAEDIFAFTDFEATDATDEDLLQNLGSYWFRDSLWNEPGYRFTPLGQNGSGGEVAVWAGRDEEPQPSVVFFGPEGGRGILAPSPLAFAQAIAHGPTIVEYLKNDPGAPSLLSMDNWFFTRKAPDQVAAARAALARYRRAVEERFGAIPVFEAVTSIAGAPQSEFCQWVNAVQQRATAREQREAELAVEEKRRDRRAKAAAFALSGTRLSPDAAPGDGVQLQSTCASCGTQGVCRVTRFEEFTFALCMRCYFSNAW